MSTASRPRVFISRRIPEKGRALVAAECDVVSWDYDEPPPRQEYLATVKGISGLLCLLTDKIDAELLDAAGICLSNFYYLLQLYIFVFEERAEADR